MPNQIDGDGLQTLTRQELVDQFTTDFNAIYGPDLNLDSDSADGQMMNIFIQSALDLEDLLVQIYNGFDPDNALGVVLDQRCAINGIQRQAGTFTTTNITVVVTEAVTLTGLNGVDTESDAYTVSDNAGNQWYLTETQSPAIGGNYEYVFRSAVPGAVLTTPNTINIPVTVVVGVESVNNPTSYLVLGINEETDAELKVRRQKSVSLSSQGYLDGLLAALLNVSGITSAFVYENNGDSTDGDGVPSHSIWVIVNGGDDVDIANAIYQKRNAGCGMFGSETYEITQVDGSPFIVSWDFVESENLYIEFDASPIDGVSSIDTTTIKAQLVLRYIPGVFELVDINGLATIVQGIDPNCLVTNAGFSLSAIGPFTETLTPSAKNKQFALAAARIDITVV